MIRPDKYMDLHRCPLKIAAYILARIQVDKAVRLTELDEELINAAGLECRQNIIPALGFLYLLGCIDYDPMSDVISTKPHGGSA